MYIIMVWDSIDLLNVRGLVNKEFGLLITLIYTSHHYKLLYKSSGLTILDDAWMYVRYKSSICITIDWEWALHSVACWQQCKIRK